MLLTDDPSRRNLSLRECRIKRQVSMNDEESGGLVPGMSWFFENREQNGLMRNIGIDLEIMEQHLVLLGNQG